VFASIAASAVPHRFKDRKKSGNGPYSEDISVDHGPMPTGTCDGWRLSSRFASFRVSRPPWSEKTENDPWRSFSGSGFRLSDARFAEADRWIRPLCCGSAASSDGGLSLVSGSETGAVRM